MKGLPFSFVFFLPRGVYLTAWSLRSHPTALFVEICFAMFNNCLYMFVVSLPWEKTIRRAYPKRLRPRTGMHHKNLAVNVQLCEMLAPKAFSRARSHGRMGMKSFDPVSLTLFL